jgi:hypothetical protein
LKSGEATGAGALSPLMTVAVSNLPTAVRNINRKGGKTGETSRHARQAGSTPRILPCQSRRVTPQLAPDLSRAVTLASTISRGVPEVLAADPFGRLVVVLHTFRRRPIMSATLICSDVGRAVEFYKTVAGMQVESAPEAAIDLHVPRTLPAVGSSEAAAPVLMINRRHTANAGLLLVPAALARAAFGVGGSGGSEGLEAGAAAAASAALEEWFGTQAKARQVAAAATTSTLHALLETEGEAEGRASTVLTFDLTSEPGCEPGTAAGVSVHRSHRAAAALGVPATEVEATGSAGGLEKHAFTCFDPDGHAVYITGPAE